MKNIIGLDISINSTGCIINGIPFCFPYHKSAYTTKEKLRKWYEYGKDILNIVTYEKYLGNDLIEKHINYEKLATIIINTIHDNIDNSLNTLIVMEGYSYSSNVGPLIDLVTLGTLVRQKAILMGWQLKFFAPKEVKYFAGESTYEKIYTNKKQTKWEFRNNLGVAAGNFTKSDILQVIYDNKTFKNAYIDFLKENFDTLYPTVPKPFEDINDAYILYEMGKR